MKQKSLLKLLRPLCILIAIALYVVISSSVSGAYAAEPGFVDATIFHYYGDNPTPVREEKQLAAGEYTLSEMFRLTENGVYEAIGGPGSRPVMTFDEGNAYTLRIYYKPVDAVVEPKTEKPTVTTTSQTRVPYTADRAEIIYPLIILIVSFAGICVTAWVKKKNAEENQNAD